LAKRSWLDWIISGDGFPDLFVGDLTGISTNGVSSGLGYVFYSAGILRGRTFSLNSPPGDISFTTLYGPLAGAIGSDTVAHADLDVDGIGDLLVGNPHDALFGRINAGSAHIIYGQPGGWPALINTKEGSLPDPQDVRVAVIAGASGNLGSDFGDILCYSAAVGDIDNDGRCDVIINEMQGNGLGGIPEDVGNLIVVSGTALLEPFTPALSYSPSGRIDFGAHDIAGGPTQGVSVTITNASTGTVSITSLLLDGPAASDYEITLDSGSSNLLPGLARNLEIRFDPTSLGDRGAALSVYNNHDMHKSGVALSGTGIDTNLVPFISRLQASGKDAGINFSSQRGYWYRLLKSADFDSWSPTQVDIFGTGGTVPLLDQGALTNDAGFYEVDGIPRGSQ
jgi:hypothetical protein